ncbi:Uroporphyrinogen-III methyltransferase [hydrothermal vent metagenome]|uniref:uroporphyrinogen-III C-methyltransferase n=1 Tax=hydrothermal vent metagenome TaxID=652676 RepID=A0A160TBF5_9ZZZZ
MNRKKTLSLNTKQSESNQQTLGKVWLVGGGPGDPELLTIKAMRVLSEADIVLYDSLISEEILAMLPKKCTRIHVGKRCGAHKMPQVDIQKLLLTSARKYGKVVRLKGGDPFIFGRGGEELEYLMKHGVEVDIVPGITAAGGCAAAAKIPLTHRQYGNALMLDSGHTQFGDYEPSQNPTRVFYMGLKQAGMITARLLGDGLNESTPVALIANGTLPTQEVHTGVLMDLPRLAERYSASGPALIIVGEVAAFAARNQIQMTRQAVA